jgi:hypothetical protein
MLREYRNRRGCKGLLYVWYLLQSGDKFDLPITEGTKSTIIFSHIFYFRSLEFHAAESLNFKGRRPFLRGSVSCKWNIEHNRYHLNWRMHKLYNITLIRRDLSVAAWILWDFMLCRLMHPHLSGCRQLNNNSRSDQVAHDNCRFWVILGVKWATRLRGVSMRCWPIRHSVRHRTKQTWCNIPQPMLSERNIMWKTKYCR